MLKPRVFVQILESSQTFKQKFKYLKLESQVRRVYPHVCSDDSVNRPCPEEQLSWGSVSTLVTS